MALAIAGAVGVKLYHKPLGSLSPRGPVARQERQLMFIAGGLSLFVVIPVFVMTFGFAYKYRASNNVATYQPNWDHNRSLEAIWWLVPSGLILILAIITWNSTHQLDPGKALAAHVKPLRVQVISLNWKWLFIYPDQGIATVNTLHVPVGTPVQFEITSDAPMNSFWIPQLGGQIYAMSGMQTQLNLEADQAGSYVGRSANISGVGFSGMTFLTHAEPAADFNAWVASAQSAPQILTTSAYTKLAQPSQNNSPQLYGLVVSNLFQDVIMSYMAPGSRLASDDGSLQPHLAAPLTSSRTVNTMNGMVMQ